MAGVPHIILEQAGSAQARGERRQYTGLPHGLETSGLLSYPAWHFALCLCLRISVYDAAQFISRDQVLMENKRKTNISLTASKAARRVSVAE